MRNIYRLMASILIIALLSTTSPAFGIDYMGETEPITALGLTSASVNLAVSQYWSERRSYLLGEKETMEWAVQGIVRDESEHVEKHTNFGIQISDISLDTTTVVCYDTCAEVSLNETVHYTLDGVAQAETVQHILTVYLTTDGTPLVAADGYAEQFSGFRSCSYVSPAALATNSSTDPGSGLCIVEIAKNELGTTETGVNMTKYGEWFGSNGENWCAIFVSWCANEANVSTDIIPKAKDPNKIMEGLDNQGCFYFSNTHGGTYIPVPGDILFVGTDPGFSSHVGIVEKVENGVVWIYDGNWSNRVNHHSYALTASDVLGYGHPNYGSSDHVCPSGEYTYDSLHHWHICAVCNAQFASSDHMGGAVYYHDGSQHWQVCSVCGIQFATGRHQSNTDYEYDYIQHWRTCNVCDRELVRIDHQLNNYYDCDSTHHWLACTECEVPVIISSHEAGPTYFSNDFQHWKECTECYSQVEVGSHQVGIAYYSNRSQHWKLCWTCGAVVNSADHRFLYNSSTGKYECVICGQCSFSIML